MPESDTALLELGERACRRPRGEAVAGVGKQGLRGQDAEHLIGVLDPIGGEVKVATRDEARGQERHERGLDQPPFVMPHLGPGIGKEDVSAC